MVRTLRRRLILSHVLPLLIIIPLIGLALVYVLETQVFLPNLASEVYDKAHLVADLSANEPNVWTNPQDAEAFVASIAPQVTERVMLIDKQGRLLASSEASDAARLGSVVSGAGIDAALAGQSSVSTSYSQRLGADVVDAVVPARQADGQMLGIVQLRRSLTSVYDRFMRQRYLIAGVLVLALIIGGAVGWALALDIAQPLSALTQAVAALASGQDVKPVEEEGPDEVRLLARSFNSLVERLTSLEAARRQLLANLVHELGRPLGALHSGIQALVRGADEDPALRRELLAGMDGEVDLLGRLLDDLAQLRNDVVGALELSLRPVAVADWLPQVLAPWREVAQQRGLQWQTEIPADLPTVEMDPDRLSQALGNLVNNAIKYTPSGGRVAVSAGIDGNNVWMRVSDDGPGIPSDEQELIFAPFYRSHRGRRFPQGMGLGLSIARSLVAAHGGQLDVRSAPGRGSDFTLWIPLH